MLAFVFLGACATALIAPLHIEIDSLRRDIIRAQAGVDDLKIHSSTESAAHFAELNQKFIEVETQFRGVYKEFGKDIEYLKDTTKETRQKVENQGLVIERLKK